MNNRRINRKIKKIYKSPINNLYSNKFYTDLFYGYEYSLSKDSLNSRDFYRIKPNDINVIKLFVDFYYDFSYKFGEVIERVLYSMAIYGKSYIFIRPEYIKNVDKEGNINEIINALHIEEVKGVLKRETFYYKNNSNEIFEINICEGTLITFNLKDLGFKKNYFTNIVKRLSKYDTTFNSIDLINNESTYDFNVHINKNRKRVLKQAKDIGWSLDKDGFSDSYILYKEIQMKLFKIRMLKYVLNKINHVLAEEYILNKDFKIEALIKNIDYEDSWDKFQKGELTFSKLSNILWK